MTGRILVVEDEVVIAMEIESVLQQMGYEVLGPVMTGQDAIALTAEKRPDLILMDIRLKGDIDGISAADHIYHLYKIPVIFLTAHSDPKTVDKAIATHPFGYPHQTVPEKRALHLDRDCALQTPGVFCRAGTQTRTFQGNRYRPYHPVRYLQQGTCHQRVYRIDRAGPSPQLPRSGICKKSRRPGPAHPEPYPVRGRIQQDRAQDRRMAGYRPPGPVRNRCRCR